MVFNRSILARAATLVATLACGLAAHSHSTVGSDEGGNLAQLVEHSNLVLVGSVARVEYRRAEMADGSALPVTFVTYEVAEVLRGESAKSITLRFVGGSDGRGGFVEANGVPQFQPGERDILFVEGNGEKECPLVLCEWGRYRLNERGVYNTHGSPVRALIKGEAIARGRPDESFLTLSYPAPAFDELIQNPEVQAQIKQMGIDPESLRARYEADAPKEIVFTRALETPTPDTGKDQLVKSDGPPARGGPPDEISEGPVTFELFTAQLKSLIDVAERKPEPVRSIDVDVPVRLPAPKDLAPREQPAVRASPSASAQERAELEALRKQDNNPVIPRK